MTCAGSLDTCAVLRIFLNDVPDQHDRIRLLLEQQGTTYQVSDLAIIESIFVLENPRGYGFSRAEVEDYLIALISRPNLNFNRQAFLTALPLYLAHPRLSFNDCLLSVYAKLNSALPLFTFDKPLARALPEAVEL
jgi:predicted nucleic-acid-binding protein